MAAGIKRFNWLKQPTRWEAAQAWRQRRSEMAQQFLSDSAATSAALVAAQSNFTAGMASLATQASVQRVQAQINAARSRAASAANSLDQLA
jgi:hypothetical protein